MGALFRTLNAARAAGAPEDEVRDLNRQLVREVVDGLGRQDYIPADAILEYQRGISQTWGKSVVLNPSLYDARNAPMLGSPVEVDRYPTEYLDRRAAGLHQSILQVSDLGIIGPMTNERWAEKPTRTGAFEFLRYLHSNLDIDQALIFTRQHQVLPFCRLFDDRDRNPLGYQWLRTDDQELTEGDREELRYLDQVLHNSGTEFDPDIRQWKLQRKEFPDFIAALVENSLVFDACPAELVKTGYRDLAGWHNIPGDTVRLAYEQGYDGDDSIVAVQIDPQGRQAFIGYQSGEIAWKVRNPRADLYYGAYGCAELEAFVRGATAYVNGFTFNEARQSRNSVPRGVLQIYGQYDVPQQQELKNQWNALVRGAANRWALPVLISPNKQEGGAVYTPLDQQQSEMVMVKWFTFIISLLCALRGVEPTEINMDAFTAKTSSMSGDNTAEKLQSSHDRGFVPLMQWLERWVNTHLIGRLTKKYKIAWVGLYRDNEKFANDLFMAVATNDEGRERIGMDAAESEDIGKAPLNATLLKVYQLELNEKYGLQPEDGGDVPGDGEHPDGLGLPDSERPPFYDDAKRKGGERRPPQRAGEPRPAARAPKAAAFQKAAAPCVLTIRDLRDEDFVGADS